MNFYFFKKYKYIKPFKSKKILEKEVIINSESENILILAPWYVYMLECSDGTIYTGITNNIEARILKHNSGKGAKYTRSRTPVKLKAQWMYEIKSEAAKAEYRFKKLSRLKKLELINGVLSIILILLVQ